MKKTIIVYLWQITLILLKNMVLKAIGIVQYTIGLEGALQQTEPCHYLSSVSSPTHTSAMCYSIQTEDSHEQHGAQSYCTGYKPATFGNDLT